MGSPKSGAWGSLRLTLAIRGTARRPQPTDRFFCALFAIDDITRST
jgi:hypothetical protein